MEKALVASLLLLGVVVGVLGQGGFFQNNFKVTYGGTNVQPSADGNSVKIILNNASVGSNFEGIKNYDTGGFSVQMQLPGNAAGVVSAFFLTSSGSNHDELDFEFLGNTSGEPIILQTNVFANGVGNREERIYMWFDASEGFHTYSVVWNPRQITFLVDTVAIRIYGNHQNIGVDYPSQPMAAYASIFDASTWATQNGKIPVNYTYAPFVASYQDFTLDGCLVSASGSSSLASCTADTSSWWNQPSYTTLDAGQVKQLKAVRETYMLYSYCSDAVRYPTPPAECALNNP